jgi:hypothetical protein
MSLYTWSLHVNNYLFSQCVYWYRRRPLYQRQQRQRTVTFRCTDGLWMRRGRRNRTRLQQQRWSLETQEAAASADTFHQSTAAGTRGDFPTEPISGHGDQRGNCRVDQPNGGASPGVCQYMSIYIYYISGQIVTSLHEAAVCFRK